MATKYRIYRLFSDDRKNHPIGWVVALTTPRGGPYPARWIDNDGTIATIWPNTHSRSVIKDSCVPATYLHRRCKPISPFDYDQIPFAKELDESLTQLGLLGDSSGFNEEAPIKMGEIYNPDAVPAN